MTIMLYVPYIRVVRVPYRNRNKVVREIVVLKLHEWAHVSSILSGEAPVIKRIDDPRVAAVHSVVDQVVMPRPRKFNNPDSVENWRSTLHGNRLKYKRHMDNVEDALKKAHDLCHHLNWKSQKEK